MDGDFDLYWTENGTNQVHRNNGDGDANNFAVTFIYEYALSSAAFANVANLVSTENGVITSETYLYDEIIGVKQGVTTSSSVVYIVDNTHQIKQGLSLEIMI